MYVDAGPNRTKIVRSQIIAIEKEYVFKTTTSKRRHKYLVGVKLNCIIAGGFLLQTFAECLQVVLSSVTALVFQGSAGWG